VLLDAYRRHHARSWPVLGAVERVLTS
jgi:hypothetical protein